jgi:hypothetical protein
MRYTVHLTRQRASPAREDFFMVAEADELAFAVWGSAHPAPDETPLVALTAAADQVAERLQPTLEGLVGTSPGLLHVRFSSAVGEDLRRDIVEALGAVLGKLSSAEDCHEYGYGRKRVQVDPAFGHSFAFAGSDWDEFFAGFWPAPDHLLISITDCGEAPPGTAAVSAGHWHPGSRCSGSWSDEASVLLENVVALHTGLDDDGHYLEFVNMPVGTPQATAAALSRFVAGWDLFGAESRLLDAYTLGFSSGPVDLLGGDNSGYTIESFDVVAGDDVDNELRKMHAVSPEKARRWLEEINHEDMLGWLADEPLLGALRARAAGRAGADI